jgi:hypothetical protein
LASASPLHYDAGHMDPAPSPVTGLLVVEDVPCPKCGYNLRGLTVPRCPECGFQFEWTDLPILRHGETPSGTGMIVASLVLFVVAAILVPVAASPASHGDTLIILAFIAVPLGLFFGTPTLQALIEHAVASWAIGRPTKRRLLAWWRGVFICDAASNITLLIGGFAFIPFERYGFWSDNMRAWPWLCLAFVESVLIQWWVVGRRLRQWDEPVDARRLLLGCCAAKLAVAVPALYLVQYIQPL